MPADATGAIDPTDRGAADKSRIHVLFLVTDDPACMPAFPMPSITFDQGKWSALPPGFPLSSIHLYLFGLPTSHLQYSGNYICTARLSRSCVLVGKARRIRNQMETFHCYHRTANVVLVGPRTKQVSALNLPSY